MYIRFRIDLRSGLFVRVKITWKEAIVLARLREAELLATFYDVWLIV